MQKKIPNFNPNAQTHHKLNHKNQTHFSVYPNLSNSQSQRPMWCNSKEKKNIKRFQLGSNWGSIIEYIVFIEDLVESFKLIWRQKVLIHNPEETRQEISLQLSVKHLYTHI